MAILRARIPKQAKFTRDDDSMADKRETSSSHTQAMMQKLENIERETAGHFHSGQARWMIPYADLLTLLLGFFVVLFASNMSKLNPDDHVVAHNQEATQEAVIAGAAAPVDEAKPEPPKAESKTNEDARLEKELAGLLTPDIAVSRQERGVVISLKDDILFAPGRSDLTPEARKTIDTLADRLSAGMGDSPRPIRVEGHTDNTPIQTSQYPSNWELSTARATNIVKYLISSHHFAPDELSAAGYGEFKPVADNSSIGGKRKNRRVDIVVLNSAAAQNEPGSETKTQKAEAVQAKASVETP